MNDGILYPSMAARVDHDETEARLVYTLLDAVFMLETMLVLAHNMTPAQKNQLVLAVRRWRLVLRKLGHPNASDVVNE